VEDRRALALPAEAAEGEAAWLRTQSAEHLRQQVVESLRRIHALLEREQRARLAHLLRAGTLIM
jgi:hypothetical protein